MLLSLYLKKSHHNINTQITFLIFIKILVLDKRHRVNKFIKITTFC